MNRRSFLRSTSALFAALACSGSKLLGQQPPQFQSGGIVTRTGPAILPDGCSRLRWADGVTVNQDYDFKPGEMVLIQLEGRSIGRAVLEHINGGNWRRLGPVYTKEII